MQSNIDDFPSNFGSRLEVDACCVNCAEELFRRLGFAGLEIQVFDYLHYSSGTQIGRIVGITDHGVFSNHIFSYCRGCVT